MGCKILISTTLKWTSTARHAAGFALAGATVEAVAPDGAPVTESRYVSASHLYRPILARASLKEAIRRSEPDLIVSCDDRAVETLLSLYEREPKVSPLASVIARSLGVPENYGQMLSRNGSLAIARALGIRTPDTYAVATEAGLDDCLRILGLPAVIKVDGSWGGDGVQVVTTREQAVSAFRKLAYPISRTRSLARAWRRKDAHCLKGVLAPRARPVSIQRFVPGRPAASAFAAWKGELAGFLAYDVLVADGVTGPPSVVRRIDCPEMEEASRKTARHFGLSGLFGLDFIRDADGALHLIEINPRATQGGTLPFGPGCDLAAALTGCITSASGQRPAIANDTVVFFPNTWLKDPASPHLASGHHDVPWDDPAILRACLKAIPSIRMHRPPRVAAAIAGHSVPRDVPLPSAATAGS